MWILAILLLLLSCLFISWVKEMMIHIKEEFKIDKHCPLAAITKAEAWMDHLLPDSHKRGFMKCFCEQERA